MLNLEEQTKSPDYTKKEQKINHVYNFNSIAKQEEKFFKSEDVTK